MKFLLQHRNSDKGMLNMRWALVLLFLMTGYAQPQNPPPTPAKGSQKPYSHTSTSAYKPSNDQRGTESVPLIVKTLVPEKGKQEAAQEAEERERKATYERWGIASTVVIAFFTVVLAVSTILLWLDTRGLRRLANQQSIDTKDALNIAKDAADAASMSAKAMILAERAYVKMSHVSPGIQWHEVGEGTFWVDVKVQNYGKTPTNVTDVVLCAIVLPNAESLPENPSYPRKQREEIPSGFLMPNDYFIYTANFGLGLNFDQVKNRSSKVWMIGYVDYIDQFKQRHRNGYARLYNRMLDGGGQNNLVLVTQDGYNYDRPRQNGEGDDWDEIPPS